MYKMRLTSGWYPKEKRKCEEEIKEFSSYYQNVQGYKRGGLVPHAGWFFCGKLICGVIQILKNNNPDPDLICVIGGHLTSNSPVLYLGYSEAETPLGNIKIDKVATEWITERLEFKCLEPNNGDNTVEIVLPFVKYFFPDVPIIGFRAPSSKLSIKLGNIIRDYADKNNLNLITIGAADLTHYGPNYDFMPAGFGKSGIEWARNNDKKLIDRILSLDAESVLSLANSEYSSCSPGPIASLIEFSKESKPFLLDYYTSYDIYPSDSFVGYVGILF
ncbi:MAG TPA: AmmeMemoRadiSam system protein B [Spirochaetota bacterium]|nr:AmmeMemoRadiSam system protein B [Spirochaetota bacterium]HOM38423.1 AmmeMemoRadiSam system protein B [Spirochaetota bacterium]HPQ48962.1 AmmeMemoRadiSam system protein B [Spirochaetota bacterium]